MWPRAHRIGPFVTLAVALSAAAAASWSGVSAQAGRRVPLRLEDTGLYEPGRMGVVAAANRRFSPQYPLWTDGAAKTRWISLPPGTTIDASRDEAWQFPVGTRFWKEFAFNGRKVETRMLWKAGEGDWEFASYLWDDGQTGATLVPENGLRGVAEVAPGRRHSIPSVADCRTCHDAARGEVLGFSALQLSTDRDPLAPHAEPLDPDMVTVRTLVGEHRLAPARPDLLAHPPRIRADSPRARAVLGYLSTNCGTCHHSRTIIATAGMRLDQTGDPHAPHETLRTLVNRPSAWTMPGTAPGASALVVPGAPERSALLYRMKSRRPMSQMPPLGTVLPDQEAIDLVKAWIREDLGGAASEARRPEARTRE